MSQRDTFLVSEGDAYFNRNASKLGKEVLEEEAVWIDVLQQHLAERSRILEIGCATGVNLERLRRLKGCLGAGVEPSPAAVKAGKDQFPDLDLRVGTADALPFPDASFDCVLFGCCLYLVDRASLPKVVAEADRVLKDKGRLAIIDFDPDAPVVREYIHAPGMLSHKMDYAGMFTGFPQYSLIEKRSFAHHGQHFNPDPSQRVAIQVLYKDTGQGYGLPR